MSFLSRILHKPEPVDPRAEARANCDRLQAAMRDAKKRGDTRDQGRILPRLRAAQLECLRVGA